MFKKIHRDYKLTQLKQFLSYVASMQHKKEEEKEFVFPKEELKFNQQIVLIASKVWSLSASSPIHG